MKKEILKLFLIFVFSISIVFFSLILFQKYTMEKERSAHIQFEYQQEEDMFLMPPAPPPIEKEPPIYIPLLCILILSSVFVFLILKYLDKNFVTPLISIQDKLINIKNGDFNVDFSTISKNDALIQTYNTLNSMVIGLKEKKKIQENFVQKLVHDLRAPLLAQDRAINILKEEFNDNELIKGLSENNENYLKMINLIIEAYSDKEISIEKIYFNLYDLLDTVINVLKPSADNKNIKINNLIEKDFYVYADYISVNRIIMNLIANAIENIDNNCLIEIKAFNEKENKVIIVEDNGKGIKKENIGNIFKKYSSDNGRSKKIVSGLGLFIVKELTEKNGGCVKVESEENKYTRFTVEIPDKVGI